MDSASRKVDSESHMKIAVDSTSRMSNSASPMKIAINSTSCMNNSASRMSFPQAMNACVSFVLLEANPRSSLKVSIENHKNSASHPGDSTSGRSFKELGE